MKKIYFLILVLMIAMPFLADACPLCQGGEGFSDATLRSYKIITGILASLPVVMVGGIFLWIRKKTGKTS